MYGWNVLFYCLQEGIIKSAINLKDELWEDRVWKPVTVCGEKHDTVSICTVIHVDIPYSPEAYLQETGRAGREQLLGFLGQELTSCSGCDVRGGLAVYQGFGLLAGWQEEEIEEALETLRRKGAIRVVKRGPWKDRITTSSLRRRNTSWLGHSISCL